MIRQAVFRNAAGPLPLLILVVACLVAASVSAQQKPVPGAVFGGGGGLDNSGRRPLKPRSPASKATRGHGRSTTEWLTRLRQARLAPAYTGTYVVWSASGALASSRIWYASEGDMRVERVDALSGQPRSTYRVTDRNGSNVETFFPMQRVLRIDRSKTPGKDGGFPNLPDAGQGVAPDDHYDAQQNSQERVAGLMADVVQFTPRDDLRYGYRVWSEQRTGLTIKLQTLDEHGRVLEQAAFSGLTFDSPANAAALLREMHHPHGWRIEHVARVPTTVLAEGWRIGGGPTQSPVPGFALQHCYRQPVPVRAADVQAGNMPISDPAQQGGSARASQDKAFHSPWFQCVFSDGLAAVSVFIEPYDAAQHQENRQGDLNGAWGATHLLARRVGDTGWVTVVGEVPPRTLKRFAANVARLP